MNEIVSTSADAAVHYLLVGSVTAAVMLTSSGLSQAGSTDTPVRPQEETLGPSERRPTASALALPLSPRPPYWPTARMLATLFKFNIGIISRST